MRNLIMLVTAAAACATPRDPIAAPNGATIRVFEEGTGAGGRIAVFQDRDGAVRTTVETARDGSATAPVHRGDMVTLANVGAPKFDLTTYVELAPGDLAIVGETRTEYDQAPSTGLVQVSLPPAPPAAVAFQVGAGRSLVPHAGAPVGVQLVDAGAGASFVVGIATDASGAPVAYTMSDATAASSATMLPAWRTDWARIDVRATAPGAIETRLDVLAGEARFPALAAAASSSTLLAPAGLGDAMDVRIAVADGDAKRTWRRVGPIAPEVAVGATDLLPAIAAVRLAAAGERPTVEWSIDGAAEADAVVIQLAWGDGDAHRWTVVAPAELRQFQFPALPDALAIWRPAGELRVGVALVDSSELAGYRELMRHGLDELAEVERGMLLRTSATGHVALP